MSDLVPFRAGNYRFLPGGFQYSAAVMADPGYRIERVRFRQLVPLPEAFSRIKKHLESLGRPVTSLCACELRSPAPMSEPDFIAFNRAYVVPLAEWKIFKNDINPVARCNLIPAVNPPSQPTFYSFSYTVPDETSGNPDFISSGAAECPDRPNYREAIVRRGETSPDALGDKLRFALSDLESRLHRMGLTWACVMNTRLYCVHDLHHLMESELVRRGAMSGGLGWHWVRPPVVDLEIEIDASSVSSEIMLDAQTH